MAYNNHYWGPGGGHLGLHETGKSLTTRDHPGAWLRVHHSEEDKD